MIIDFLGDISLTYLCFSHNEQASIASSINQQLGECDFRIANLESPMLLSRNHKEAMKEEAGDGAHLCMYSDLHSPFFDTLNVDAYTLANNHIFDYGESGLRDTLVWIEHSKKKHVGASLGSQTVYEPIVVENNDGRIAIFSLCENEFGIAVGNKPGAAGFNYRVISACVLSWRYKVDAVVIVFHGGNEHYPFPSPKQKDTYHRLVDIGVDMIIGIHSHCPVGKEVYKGKEIYYGLGNFYFPKKTFSLYPNDNYGYLVRMTFKKGRINSSEILPYSFEDSGKSWGMLKNPGWFYVYYKELSDTIYDDNRLNELFQGWSMFYGRILYRLLIDAAKMENDVYSQNIIKNLFSCESHNELLTEFLNRRYYSMDSAFENAQGYIKKMIGMMKTTSDDDCDEIVWGCTERSYSFIEKEKKLGKKIRVIDSDVFKQGLYFCNIIVSPTQNIPRDVDIYIGTSKNGLLDISRMLIDVGVSNKNIKWINEFCC